MVRPRLLPTQRAQLRRISTAITKEIPAPVEGVNTRDTRARMKITHAIQLRNGVADGDRVMTRGGSIELASGLGGKVGAGIGFDVGTDQHHVVAANSKIQKVTSVGGLSDLGTGFANNDWYFAMLKGRLFMVNGADGVRRWDGTTFDEPSFSGTGITVANLIGVHNYRGRLFFWEANSADFAYAAAGALSGTLTLFSLSEFVSQGGHIVAMANITRDGGAGPDDMLAIFISTGEIIVYLGSDPGDVRNWLKIGNYKMPPLTGPRAIVPLGSNIWCQTQTDYVALADVMAGRPLDASLAVKLIKDAYAAAANKTEWQAIYHSGGNLAIFNAPRSDGKFDQHVLRVGRGGWSTYNDLDAAAWWSLGKEIYFGTTDGRVIQAEIGTNDEGASIDFFVEQAPSNLGIVEKKRVNAARAILETKGVVNYNFQIGFDYRQPAVPQPLSTASGGTPWGSPWGSPWSPPTIIDTAWRGARGVGTALGMNLRINALQPISWLRTDLKVEVGKDI